MTLRRKPFARYCDRHMMRRLRFVVMFLLSVGSGMSHASEKLPLCPPTARVPTAEENQAAMRAARDRGFLWRVRKDGHTSYLYGTLHVGKLDWMYPGPTIIEAVRSSDVVALELDMMDPLVREKIQSGMSSKLDVALPAELSGRLRAQVEAACLPEELLTTQSPEMLATTLVVMSGRQQGLDPSYAIDGLLAGLGHGLDKSVLSLETPESQLALLQGGTPEETRTMVDQALLQLETGKAGTMMARLAQIWSDGRFNEMETYERWCDCVKTDADRAWNKRLIDDRNPLLASRIDALHAEGKQVFAAVGSLHMIGKVGLPALMRQHGYAVERVTFQR
jgi:uncharacterized protein